VSGDAAELVPGRLPRSEYPRPQFVRSDWLCLNGEWEFEIDRAGALNPTALAARPLAQSITVPFAPESALSGIGVTDFLEVVWYRRDVSIPDSWGTRRVLLHFQACDHDTTVWVNGQLAGKHRGGFTPFSFDITELIARDRSARILVRARDSHDRVQARGKQSRRPENYEAYYTRTTGIWQTVWMEPVDPTHLERPRITPDLERSEFCFEIPISGAVADASVDVIVSDAGGVIAHAVAHGEPGFSARAVVPLPADRVRAWSPEDPHLYQIDFVVTVGGRTVDTLSSYAGLRSIGIDGARVLLNGEPVFQRLVLDQGWYPQGLMTAPSEADLIGDIELSLAAGFNGARLHQKVFEERYLYHADRLGYLVWGEFADWGARVGGKQSPNASFITQWIEALERDYSHPSIVGWCPLNETFEELGEEITALDDVTLGIYRATKAIDQHRPVIDASGYAHRVPGADIYDSHSYEQDPKAFAEQMSGLAHGDPFVNRAPDGSEWSVPYRGQPYFCSEFGGIWWAEGEKANSGSWGYGDAPRTIEEWYERAEGLFSVLLNDPRMFGYCFTQLTDVLQEKNGIFTFDRRPKFDLARIRAIQSSPAAIEDRTPLAHAGRGGLRPFAGTPVEQ
jgi:beta-galactosidase/beta-glucuronidase